MEVHCPNCGEMLRAEDMNLENMVGRCRRCHALVNLWNYVPQDKQGERAYAPEKARRDVPRPAWLTVEDTGAQLRISWRWLSWELVYLVFFCVAWDSFLVFWYSMGIGNPGMPWIFFVFPIAHVAIGVELTYSTLAVLLNRTIVTVDVELLRVRHGPLPWRGNVAVPIEQIAQLYVAEKEISETSRHRWFPSRTQDGESFFLKAVLQDDSSQTLLSMTDLEAALYLEQEIERFLGIPDKPVGGELSR